MIEKIVEFFTPEFTTIAIVALSVFISFMFLMLLITIASLSRVKKRLLVTRAECLELEKEHALLRKDNKTINAHTARLDKAAEKIVALESHVHNIEEQIPTLAEATEKIVALESHVNHLQNHIPALDAATENITSIEGRLLRVDERITESQKRLAELAGKLNEHATLIGQAAQLVGKEAAGFNQAVQRIHILEEEFQGLKVFQRTSEQIRNRMLSVLGALPVETPLQNALTTKQEVSEEETVIPSEGKLLDTEDIRMSRMRYP